ncbi:hypothetical protein BGZ51_005088 [Haplosporangium sp. Z 767]|nr:hypothetical protein BGZ51_005088 [Haplosporangium sp. Z 767]
MAWQNILRPTHETEPLQRRLRPRKSKHASGNNAKVPGVYQETVLAIPELLDLITGYLTRDDVRVLIRVCRSWNTFWAPYLYSKLLFRKYRRTRVYPKIRTYGQYVKTLELHSTKWNNILHLLDYAPNLQSLTLHQSALSLIQLQEIVAMVPQLSGLHLSIKSGSFKPHDCPLTLAASLPNLEQFSWTGLNNEIRVDDILYVLKSCIRLRSLCLSHIVLVEELLELTPADNPEEPPRTMIKVEDHGWQNTSLRRLDCNLVSLGPYQIRATESEDVHPYIRRLFSHMPNLTTLNYTGKHNLDTLDWDYIFENRTGLQHVQLWPLAHVHCHCTPLNPSKTIDALNAVAKYCDNLKVLDVKNTFPTTDDVFKRIMERNHQLQRVCVKNTDIGDLPLQALARLPAFCTTHNLVELDLERCINITSAGVIPVLENCGRLQNLNLSRTKAGTLDLFKGNKPWACRTSLEVLLIDIQPQDYQPPPRMINWTVTQQRPPVILYSPEEQLLIKKRLTSLTALRKLEIKGLVI